MRRPKFALKTPEDDRLEEAVAELLVVTGQLTRRLRAVSNSRELTWSQVAIMGRLEGTGPMTTADLARAEVVTPQSMGAALAVLEELGFVARRNHPTDGRQVLFSLTGEGIATRRQVGLAKQDWLYGVMAKLDANEQALLIDAVKLIRRMAEP